MGSLIGTAMLEEGSDGIVVFSLTDAVIFALVVFLIGCAVTLGKKRLPQ